MAFLFTHPLTASRETIPMNDTLNIKPISSINEQLSGELNDLLLSVVESGASIGFVLPITKSAATKYWQSVINDNTILLVATLNGQLCGTAQLHLIDKPNGMHRCEIAKVIVSPNFQRQGIGRKLMQAIEQQAIKHNRTLMVLDTRQGDPSNQLYQSLGFIQAGIIPDFASSVDGVLEPTVYYYKKLHASATS